MNKNSITLKKIRVKKESLEYFFIGGMVYNKKLSFDTGSRNSYPFTSYFVDKVEDITEDGVRYRSLIYCKLPLICLQFKNHCKCIEFELPAKCGNKEVVPFVGLEESENYYEIIFKIFPEFYIREKKNAWLGFSKVKKIKMPSGKLMFKVKEYEKKDWTYAVKEFFEKQKIKYKLTVTGESIKKIKNALFRSYDDLLGTFIQMPWKNVTGFCMDKYSYSLLGFEAKRLNYFQQLYEKTNDPDYLHWTKKLEKLFLNKDLYREGNKGLVWYNTTHFNGKKLNGFFYLDIGYGGYPPGQATIAFNLGEYLERRKNEKLKRLLKKSLKYILNTQNKDGSWYSAIPSGGISKRKWEESEGSTGSCVRALLKGYEIFKDKKYVRSSKKALKFLERKNIICRNSLRDIAINEPEAFSAIVVLNAFLDAFEVFKKEKYLEFAKRYAYYLLGWAYWYGDLKGFFHPISESINPRISPYETLLLVNSFKRLSKKTHETFWSDISNYLFSKVLGVVDKNNGLSEGIFPKINGGFYGLPMEQTFATAELLYTCFIYNSYRYKKPKKLKLNVKEKNGYLILEDTVKINEREYEIKINGRKLKIEFSRPYKIRSKLYTKFSKSMRRFGLLNMARDIEYLFTGVHTPKRKKPSLELVDSYVKKFELEEGKDEVVVKVHTDFHKIRIRFYKAPKLRMEMKIFVKEHDLVCDRVLINGKDYTLDTNWTNGGIFKKEIIIS